MITLIDSPVTCCDSRWEAAYLAFESPEEEIRKFLRRLRRAGAREWPRDARIVEICCGRGNGIVALARLGFNHVEGVDLSASLLNRYLGPAHCYICDCRRLPFEDASRDIVIVQGGLHHLPELPEDLRKTIREAARILRAGGLFVAVEPWMTPFLSLVHRACGCLIARRLWRKLDAVGTMNEYERSTYERWLQNPALILDLLSREFDVAQRRIGFGKLLFVGKKRAGARESSHARDSRFHDKCLDQYQRGKPSS